MYSHNRAQPLVAPYTGAWIEITRRERGHGNHIVAPYTGAWIEILTDRFTHLEISGRSLHGSVD